MVVDLLKKRLSFEKDLLFLESLQKGWDGDDAEEINREILKIVRNILEQLQLDDIDIPNITPVIDGSIDLTWKKKGLFCTIDYEELVISVAPPSSNDPATIRTETCSLGNWDEMNQFLIKNVIRFCKYCAC